MNSQLTRLNNLLSIEELETLVKAFEVIHLQGGGYGTVLLEFSNQWLVRACPTPSIKTRSIWREGNKPVIKDIQAIQSL